MAKIIKINRTNRKEYKPCLYDSDTGASCKTEKVVDITKDCPKAIKNERAVLIFTRAKLGRIVQINRHYKGEVCMGVRIHFLVDELDHEMRVAPRNDTFGSTSNKLGLAKSALRSLIKAHAPA